MGIQPSSSSILLLSKDSDNLFDFREKKQAKIKLEASSLLFFWLPLHIFLHIPTLSVYTCQVHLSTLS